MPTLWFYSNGSCNHWHPTLLRISDNLFLSGELKRQALLLNFEDHKKLEKIWNDFMEIIGNLKLDLPTDEPIAALTAKIKWWFQQFLSLYQAQRCDTLYARSLPSHSRIFETVYQCSTFQAARHGKIFLSTAKQVRFDTCSSRNSFHLVLLCVTFAVVFFTLSLWTMTDTQERVEVNLITNGKRFGFLRRLVNSCIASEWSFSITIAAVVVVGAALYHHHVISYLEARFETTVKKMLDEREQGSNAFIKEAIKESETNMLKRLLGGNVKL